MFQRNHQDLYQTILISVDNSEHSRYAEELGLIFGKALNAKITGLHVYSGMFHQFRFKILEEHLPNKYQKEEVLDYQRKIHSVLIERGLELISLEYMKHLNDACHQSGILFEEKLVDGKNSDAIIEQANTHDIVMMGALGIGSVPGFSTLGSNTRRVLQSVDSDVFIVRKKCDIKNIIVGIDGSDYSFKVLEHAAQLATHFDAKLHVFSCYNPGLHRVVFQSLANVLSDEAGKVFKFREQEQLHNQVIDHSLENLYQEHLEKSRIITEQYHVPVSTELLKGKPYIKLNEKATEIDADLLIVGRFGMHRGQKERIGSNAERTVELAKTNVLVVSLEKNNRTHNSASDSYQNINEHMEKLIWNDDAKKRLENIPSFARPMAILAIERYAREKGINLITPDIMRAARGRYEQ